MTKINMFFLLFLVTILNLTAGEYAEMYANNSSVDVISSSSFANTWINPFVYTEGVHSSNWHFDPNSDGTHFQLIKNYTDEDNNGNGIYIINYSISFYATPGDWSIGMSLDSQDPTHIISRKIDNASTVGNASGSVIFDLTKNTDQIIALYLRSTEVAYDLIIRHAQIIVTEITQDELGTFGGMYYSQGDTHQEESFAMNIDIPDSTWTQLSGFSQAPNLLNVSKSGNSLQVGSSGIYLVSLAMSFWGDSIYQGGISVNGAEPAKSKFERTFSTNASIGSVGSYALLDLAANDNISVMLHRAAGDTLSLVHANLTAYKLGSASSGSAPYANMDGGLDVTIPSPGTDVQVLIPQSNLDGSSWTFDSGTLSPIGSSAGYYLLDYTMSMTLPSDADDESLYLVTSIFKNGVKQDNFIAERGLSKRSDTDIDIGSLSGTGIIKITSEDDDISFSVNNTTGADLIIKHIEVTLHRISTLNDGTLPVQFSSFEASALSHESVALAWTVQSETNGSCYRIYRNTMNDFNSATALSRLVPALNLTQTHTYSFVDTELEPSYLNLFYWVEFVELDNSSQSYGPVMVELNNGQTDTPEVMFSEGIKSAYPNPFNPDVTISYYLNSPKAANFQVYNLKGQLINKLTSATENVGFHQISWDGKDVSGRSVSSGTYFIKATNLKNDTPIKVILSK